jgi:hypothetical protein
MNYDKCALRRDLQGGAKKPEFLKNRKNPIFSALLCRKNAKYGKFSQK